MTAATAPPPKILLAVGAPDDMTGAEATKRYWEGRLHGITGMTAALLPALRERGLPYAVLMLGPRGRVDGDFAQRMLSRTGGGVLVNLICDPDAQGLSLQQVARFELETQLPAINPSWAVGATGRPAIARRLAHQAGVRVPRCTVYRTGTVPLAEHIELHGHRYPVLLRPPGEHGSVGLVRIDDPGEATTKAPALPACTVTDFVDFRSGDGLWRKYRMVYAGDRLFRRHMLAERGWNLTRDARTFMREHPHLVAEEKEWITRPVALESGSVEARVMHQFRALQLDFGAIDFALPPSGELVIFEINGCVQLTTREDAQAAGDRRYFQANNEEILDTLLAHIHSRAAPR